MLISSVISCDLPNIINRNSLWVNVFWEFGLDDRGIEDSLPWKAPFRQSGGTHFFIIPKKGTVGNPRSATPWKRGQDTLLQRQTLGEWPHAITHSPEVPRGKWL